jgi:hypothetical protein
VAGSRVKPSVPTAPSTSSTENRIVADRNWKTKKAISEPMRFENWKIVQKMPAFWPSAASCDTFVINEPSSQRKKQNVREINPSNPISKEETKETKKLKN